jgi:hypothetical protein
VILKITKFGLQNKFSKRRLRITEKIVTERNRGRYKGRCIVAVTNRIQ